jgi:hypothetical protein
MWALDQPIADSLFELKGLGRQSMEAHTGHTEPK